MQPRDEDQRTAQNKLADEGASHQRRRTSLEQRDVLLSNLGAASALQETGAAQVYSRGSHANSGSWRSITGRWMGKTRAKGPARFSPPLSFGSRCDSGRRAATL